MTHSRPSPTWPRNHLTLERPPRRRVGLGLISAARQAGSRVKTTIFKIEGMSCDACASTIRSIIEKEPGVRMASVSFSDRLARVLYDPQAGAEDRLVDAIQ